MRTYAPRDTPTVLQDLLAEPSLARGVVHHATLPARAGTYAPLPDWLDERIRHGLAARGIERLYVHQAEALETIRAGSDVVVVTPTASGKTLCYDAARPRRDRATTGRARALPLPDQGARPGPGRRAAGSSTRGRPDDSSRTYDGDTPAPDPRPRSAAPARSSSPTRTCSTRRSCRTTRSGSSCSSTSGSS